MSSVENLNSEVTEDTTPVWKRRRVWVVFILFVGLNFGGIFRTNLGITMVAMVEQGAVDFNTVEQGLAISAVFWGFISTQIFGGVLSTKFGGSLVFSTGILLSGIFTLLTPLAIYGGFGWLLAVRILTGMADGLTFPSSNHIVSVWVPPYERTRVISAIYAAMLFGSLIILGTGGVIINSFNWQAVYYIFGITALVYYLIWILTVYKSPETDRFISESEKTYILTSLQSKGNDTKNIKIPWKAILTSSAVWAIFAAQFALNWGLYTLLTQMPAFLVAGLNTDFFAITIFAIGLLIVTLTSLVVAGIAADLLQKKKILSTYTVRRYFTSVSHLTQGILLIISAFIANRIANMVILILAAGLGTFSASGFGANHLDIAPLFAGVITGIANTLGTIPGMISPIIAGFIVTDQTNLDQWMWVFIIIGCWFILGSAVFWFFAKGEVQEWAVVKNDDDQISNGSNSNFNDKLGKVEV